MTAAEHREAQRAARAFRNAWARRRLRTHRQARQWCDERGAVVTPFRTPAGALRYTVKVSGFAASTQPTLALAVAQLQAAIDHFLEAGATLGPTGGRLDRYRALRVAYTEPSERS